MIHASLPQVTICWLTDKCCCILRCVSVTAVQQMIKQGSQRDLQQHPGCVSVTAVQQMIKQGSQHDLQQHPG
jgi:hypothetical protein